MVFKDNLQSVTLAPFNIEFVLQVVKLLYLRRVYFTFQLYLSKGQLAQVHPKLLEVAAGNWL